MAENVLAMTLRMRNHAIAVARNLRTEINNISTDAARMGTVFGKSIKATRTSMAGLAGSLISLKTLIIAAFAYRGLQKFGHFLGSLTEAAEKQEQAVLRLGEALASAGNYTKNTVLMLEKYAGVLQETQAIRDDVILSNMALLASYGMEADEIMRLTPLLHDFAKAKGIELRTAFDLAGKASVGYTGTLSRYGIIIDQTLSKSEKYAKFLEAISQFHGTAATLANSYTGAVERLKASYGDMKEPMGAIIRYAVEQSGILETLIKIVKNVREWFAKWQPTIEQLATKALAVLNNRLQDLIKLMSNPITTKWFITMGQSLQLLIASWKQLNTLIVEGLGFMVKSAEIAKAAGDKIRYSLFGSKEEKEAADKAWKEATKGFWEYVDNGARAVTDGFKDVYETMKDAASTVAEVWQPGGLEKYLAKLEEQNNALKEIHKNERKSVLDSIQNRQKQNEVMEETIKITKSMAQQFATASRLEQEQVKYLLGKLQTMDASDVGSLTEVEKELISKQGVLKEAAKRAFGEYASKALGLTAEFSFESESTVSIDLTDEAKQLIKVASNTTKRRINHGFEKSMSA